jgi:hypothetical protein
MNSEFVIVRFTDEHYNLASITSLFCHWLTTVIGASEVRASGADFLGGAHPQK